MFGCYFKITLLLWTYSTFFFTLSVFRIWTKQESYWFYNQVIVYTIKVWHNATIFLRFIFYREFCLVCTLYLLFFEISSGFLICKENLSTNWVKTVLLVIKANQFLTNSILGFLLLLTKNCLKDLKFGSLIIRF